MSVLCVGALAHDTIFHFDTLPAGPGKFLPHQTIEVTQGMATAQAATITRLGGHARLWASAGDDLRGDRMVAELAAEGIDGAIRRVRGARSGFASILMDKSGERIIVPGYDTALATPPAEPPPIDGITVVSVDVRWPAAAQAALRAARERGIPGVLDLENAHLETLHALVPLATHIIASVEGARRIAQGNPAQMLSAIASLAPAAVVAITDGENGVYWPGSHMPAFPVKAVDTLAAGDVFHGAFAFGLSEGWDIDRNLRFASAAAAIKCTRPGGRLGAPTRVEVETFLAERA
jgi:sulfofructose kinase